MSTSRLNRDESLVIPGRWDITYQYSAGPIASHFFASLRDKGIILATRCSNCQRAMLPPRGYCEKCFKPVSEWLEVGPEGRVVTFTISHRKFGGASRKPPFVLALIKLDGADTNIIHMVDGVDVADPAALLEQVRKGLRVRAEFLTPEQRTGTVLDISSFRVIS